VLREGDKVPSVRELAARLAVNQNTILKVYNELCRENVLRVERGDGTYVSSSRAEGASKERERLVAGALREAALMAVQLDVPAEKVLEMLKREYASIVSQRGGSGSGGSGQRSED
jgi:GntR family transcriptional regulator